MKRISLFSRFSPNLRPSYHAAMRTWIFLAMTCVWLCGAPFPAHATEYVRYESCMEYVYRVQAKASLQGDTHVVMKAKIGFETLFNVTPTEIRLHIHDARMQQGAHEVSLNQVMNLGRWFSAQVDSLGHVTDVFFPPHEEYDVISVKKTFMSYISGKYNHDPESLQYSVHETDSAGKHRATYARQHMDEEVIFVKEHHRHGHKSTKHGTFVSSRTTTVNKDTRVPHKVSLHENVEMRNNKLKIQSPKFMGRNRNYSEERAHVKEFPSITMQGVADVEMIDIKKLPCVETQRPPDALRDELAILFNKQVYSRMRTEDFSHNVHYLHQMISGNISCVEGDLREDVPTNSKCFTDLVKTLELIPEELLEEVLATYFVNENGTLMVPLVEKHTILLDAVIALRSPLCQDILFAYFFNQSEVVSWEILHRLASHLTAFDEPPIPEIIGALEDLAFRPTKYIDSRLSSSDTDHHNGILLALASVVNIMQSSPLEDVQKEAHRIRQRFEKMAGFHDPYHWKLHRSRRSLPDYQHLLMRHSVVLESLGNIASKNSLEVLCSHMNHSETPYQLRRAAISAMRHFHCEKSAEMLMQAALFDDEFSLQDEALRHYLDHPLATDIYALHAELTTGFLNGTYPQCPKELSDGEKASLPHHVRVRRNAIWKGIQFRLATPPVEWAKRFGNEHLGASMGLRIRNELDIDIQLHKGKAKIDIDDHAYAMAHIGWLGKDFTLLDARVCLIGGVEYELNLLQEYGFNDVLELVKFWDRFQNNVVNNIKRGVEGFRQFLSGVKDFHKSIQNIDKLLDELPQKVKNLRKHGLKVLTRLGEIPEEDVPPFARPLKSVLERTVNLYSDVKTDVMGFYNSLVDMIKVQIPMSWRQIREGVQVIGQSIRKLFKSPKEAISGIFKAVTKVKMGIDSLLDAKNRTMEACFFLKETKPYWWDMKTQLKSLEQDYKSAWKVFSAGVGPYLKEKHNKMEKAMRQEVVNIFTEAKDEILQPFKDLENLAFPFVNAVRIFTTTVQDVKEAYENLKTAYQEAQAIIDRLFGPKAYIEFPRTMRSPGSGCSDYGSYPASQSRYGDPGIDLIAEAGKDVKAPFDGRLSALDSRRVVLVPQGSSLTDMSIVITNLQAAENIPRAPKYKIIYKSDIMGRVLSSSCVNHIHLSIKEKGVYVDPTRFLSAHEMKMPLWVEKCDEYKLVYLGRTLQHGRIIRSTETPDTSPERSITEPENVDLPSPKKTTAVSARVRRDADKEEADDESVINQVTKQWDKFSKTMAKFFELPEDSSFKQFFRKFNINQMRLGTMVGLLYQLNMDESKGALVSLIHEFINLEKSPRCYLPEQMSTEQLQIELARRGVQINATREGMIQRFYDLNTKCPLHMPSLPRKAACFFDERCIGLECCIEARLGIFVKSTKAWLRLDPCTLTINMGVELFPSRWEHSVKLLRITIGEEEEKLTNVKIKLFGDEFRLKTKFSIQNDENSALLQFRVALCDSSNEEFCLPDLVIFKDLLLPLPTCDANGVVHWPQINVRDFLSRENIIRELKQVKTNVRKSSREMTLAYLEKKLDLPAGFLEKSLTERCYSPRRMTREQLLQSLTDEEAKKQALQLTDEKLRVQVSAALRKCRWFQLPEVPAEFSSNLFCSISANCFDLRCCAEIPLPIVQETFTLRTFATFDPCQFSFSYGVGHIERTVLLLDYEWGTVKEWSYGVVKIRYSISRDTEKKVFQVRVGLKLCLKEEKHCLIDGWILDNHVIPIPLCNENFTNCFQDVVPLNTLVERGVKARTKEAMWTVLRCLELDQYLLSDIGCPGEVQTVCSTSSIKPRVLRTCGKDLPCWSIQCNLNLNLFLMEKSVCVWFAFNPCTYDMQVGLGAWNFTTNLMQGQQWGVQKTVLLSKMLRINYRFQQSEDSKHFVVDLSFGVCYKGTCTLDQPVMDKVHIAKPLCADDAGRSLPGGDLPSFIKWLAVNSTNTVGQLAVDRALSHLGLKTCLSDSTCVFSDSVTVDGWENQCSAASLLPNLPHWTRCSLSADCGKLDCCLDYDIVIWQGSVHFQMEFDMCSSRMSIRFEDCHEKVEPVPLQVEQTEHLSPNITLKYLVEHENLNPVSSYLISAKLHICQFTCSWLVLMDRTRIQANCGSQTPSVTSLHPYSRRHRRSVSAPDTEALVQQIGRKIPGMLNRFDELLSEGKAEAKQSYLELQKSMGQLYESMYNAQTPFKTVFVTPPESDTKALSRREAGSILAKPSLQWNVQIVPPSGGAELFEIKRGPNGQVLFEVGRGLTEAGIAVLGDALANMTIGDLEATIDYENVDPVVAFRILRQMRKLYFALVSEAIDVFFNGKLDDKVFKSFDYVIRGAVNLPRVHVRYFAYRYDFFIIPVPCVFSLGFGADGYYGVNFQAEFYIIKMVARGIVDPYVGLQAYGFGAADCVIFKGEVRLTGYIMETHLPSTLEVGFYKFPLDVGLNVDIVIIPLRLELSTDVQMRVLFFMGRKRRFLRRIVNAVKRVVRVIGQVIGGILRIVEKVFKWITLFHKVLWSWSMSPYRIPGIIQHKRKKDDLTPPQFSTIDMSFHRNRRDAPTSSNSGCQVEQVRGRPYQSPAIWLRSDPTDDVSKVRMLFSIGSTSGGVDIANNMPFTGPVALLEGLRTSVSTLHFTITATNSQGLQSQTSCVLHNYDMEPPKGQVTIPYPSSSSNERLDFTATLQDTSDIVEVLAAVGYGPGIVGDTVRKWAPVPFTRSPSSPHSKEQVFTVSVSFTNLDLVHAQAHFVNLLVKDAMEYRALLSSNPVITDFTPPTTPEISNITRTQNRAEKCSDLLLPKWSSYCKTAPGSQQGRSIVPVHGRQRRAVSIPNHRIVVDGDGNVTAIFNGETPLRDLKWSSNNHYLSANFEPFHDNETDILGYTICFGRTLCSCDAFSPFDPHESAAGREEWNFKGYAAFTEGRIFSDGKYFVTIGALNRAEVSGPYRTTVCHSTPQVVDTTPPIVHSVTKLRYDMESSIFSTHVLTKDDESALKLIKLGAGLTKHDLSVAPMRLALTLDSAPLFYDGVVMTHLNILDGQRVYVHITVSNNVNLNQDYTAPRPFLVDSTPPLAGEVFIGPRHDRSSAYFKHFSELCVSWRDFHDPESGIDSYQVILEGCVDSSASPSPSSSSTSPSAVCSTVLHEWDNIPSTHHQLCLDSEQPFLSHNSVYRARLIAFNGGHARLNVTAWSSQILLDTTPPILGEVIDGNRPEFQAQKFTSLTSSYSLQWTASLDPESSIRVYSVHVLRNEQTIRTVSNINPSSSSLHVEGLHLQHNDKVKAILISENGALAVVERRTEGLLVDLTPPVVPVLYHGTVVGESLLFQTATDSLSIVLRCQDPESGVARLTYQLYEWVRNRHKYLDFERSLSPDQVLEGDFVHNISGLTLLAGKKYGVKYTVRNQAGLSTVQETQGITVDNTPPLIEQVRLHKVNGDDDTEVHDEIVWQYKTDEIVVYVVAMDPESGIEKVVVDIGTEPFGHDIVHAREFIYHSEVSLRVTNLSLTYTNESGLTPLYYVSVTAVNYAGLMTPQPTSAPHPLAVVRGDSAGVVLDGPEGGKDWQWQVATDVLTASFQGVESPLHGVSALWLGVGSEPGLDNVLPFTQEGFVSVQKDNGQGSFHTPISLQEGKKYFVTLETVTGAQRVLRSTSSGILVHRSPPLTSVVSPVTNSSTQYIASNPSSQVSWFAQDTVKLDLTSTLIRGSHPLVNCPFAAAHYGSLADGFYQEPHHLMNMNEELTHSTAFLKTVEHTTPGEGVFVQACTRNELGVLAITRPALAFVMDDSPPQVEGFYCDPNVVLRGNSRTVHCYVKSVLDKESGIASVMLSIVSGVGSTELPFMSRVVPCTEKEMQVILNEQQKLPETFVALLTVKNAASLQSYTYSGVIHQTSSYPQPGVVVELGDSASTSSQLQMEGRRKVLEICHSADSCLQLAQRCVASSHRVTVAWSPFWDEVNSTFSYEVALGSSPNSTNIVNWTPARERYFTFQNIDLRDYGKVYTTVRGTSTTTGLSALATSNGVYFSYLASAKDYSSLIYILDGDNPAGSSSFTADPLTMRARWNVAGEPCPLVSVQWKIERVDGLVVQNYTEMGKVTEGVYFGLSARNGDTFFNYLQVSNALDLTFTFRSPSITVKLEPIVPGEVYDGPVLGRDLNWQSDMTTISANWKGFQIPSRQAYHNMATSVSEVIPQIDYFEVAVGTDRRGNPATMSNVVPYTRVGLNTSVEFTGLQLQPQATYYVTVIAHSRWFTSAQSSSNGIQVGQLDNITAGEIYAVDFTNQSDNLDVKWSPFKSASLQVYFLGVRSYNGTADETLTAPSCDHLLPTQSNSQFLDYYFDIHPLLDMGKTTSSAVLTLLRMQHNKIYDVRVIGLNNAGQCAMAKKLVRTDFTPPLVGEIHLEDGPGWRNPETEQMLKFVRRADHLLVEWKNFIDPESGIRSYTLTLLQSRTAGCDNLRDTEVAILSSGLPAVFQVSGNSVSFEMDEILLKADHAYFVSIESKNQAGLTSSHLSEMALLETASLRVGSVLVGPTYSSSVLYMASPDNVTVNLLHTVGINSSHLIPRRIHKPLWIVKESRGFSHTADYPWPAHFSQEMVDVAEDQQTVTVRLRRQVHREGVLCGSVSSALDMEPTRRDSSVFYKFSFQLQTAPGPFTVTSVLLSDPDWVGDNEMAHKWLVVDTLDGLVWDAGREEEQEEGDVSGQMTRSACAKCCRGSGALSCACDCSSVDKDQWTSEDLDFNVLPGNGTHFSACGLQFYYKNSTLPTLLMWCKKDVANEDEFPRMQLLPLRFDPSQAQHSYRVEMTKNVLGSVRFVLLIDDMEVGEITSGIPSFTHRRWFTLQVWNRLESLPPLENPFHPYEVSAVLYGLSVQSEKFQLFDYGQPFLWNAPVRVKYEARIVTAPSLRESHENATVGNGTASEQVEILGWTEMSTTCVPCDSRAATTCTRVYCDSSCREAESSIEEISHTFASVDFGEFLDLVAQGEAVANATVANLTRFVVEVRLETVAGFQDKAVSLPVTVDFTPPEADLAVPWSYYDVASKDPYIGVRFQASNDTIKLQWNIYDPESGVEEYEWAIGSSVGDTDIMEFHSVGLNTTAERSGLQLLHNHTYYASVAAMNRAGLVSIINDADGVVVLSEPPSVEQVNVTLPGTTTLPENVDPQHTTQLTLNPQQISVQWSDPEEGGDQNLNKAEFCVGSTPQQSSDVLDCISMERNGSEPMTLTFRNGHMERNNEGPLANISDLVYRGAKPHTVAPHSLWTTTPGAAVLRRRRRGLDEEEGLNSNKNDGGGGGMNLEPGKHLYYHLRLCNAAMKCSEKPTQPVLVGANNMVLLSTASTLSQNERLGDDEDHDLSAGYMLSEKVLGTSQFKITFDTENLRGPALFAGVVNESSSYQSDGVFNYKSYIVNPHTTMEHTSRPLMRRIRQVLQPSFFLTPLQQLEQSGPIFVRFDLNKSLPIPPEAQTWILSLIYWHKDEQIWTSALNTCSSNMNKVHENVSSSDLAVAICFTQNEVPDKQYSNAATLHQAPEYFKYETQFALAYVTPGSVNTAPTLLNAENLELILDEKTATMVIQLQAFDAEGDPIVWSIIDPQPKKGTARIDPSRGLLAYRAFPEAVGSDSVWIRLQDNPPSVDVPSAHSDYRIPVVLSSEKSRLYLLLSSVEGLLFTMSETDLAYEVVVESFIPTENNSACVHPLNLGLICHGETAHENSTEFIYNASAALNVTLQKYGVALSRHEIVDERLRNVTSSKWIKNKLIVVPLFEQDNYENQTIDLLNNTRLELLVSDTHGGFSKPVHVKPIWKSKLSCEWAWWFYVAIVVGAVLVAGTIISIVVLVARRLRFSMKYRVAGRTQSMQKQNSFALLFDSVDDDVFMDDPNGGYDNAAVSMATLNTHVLQTHTDPQSSTPQHVEPAGLTETNFGGREEDESSPIVAMEVGLVNTAYSE